MAAIRLGSETVWEAKVSSTEDLHYAFWIDPKPYKAGTSGEVIDANGTSSTASPRPLAVSPSEFPLLDSPRWVHSTTIYRIELDRFDRDDGHILGGQRLGSQGGSKRLGGNLRGVVKHLSDLATNSFGAILLSPIAQASDPFGRAITDASKIDSHLGDVADLKDVLSEAKRFNLIVLGEGPAPGGLPPLDGWVDPKKDEGWHIAPERPSWDRPAKAQTSILTDWFESVKKWIHDPEASATNLDSELRLERDLLPDALVNDVIHALGGQDSPRPSSEFRDAFRLRQAWALLMTYPGIPLVRAGDDIGLFGGPFPDNRAPMPWNPGVEDASLQNFIKTLITLRSNRPSLWRGNFETLVTNDDLGLFGFVRRDRFEATLVLCNNSDKAVLYNTAAGRFGDNLSDLLGNAGMGVDNGVLSVNVAPHSFAVIGTN
jgi:glycosidase